MIVLKRICGFPFTCIAFIVLAVLTGCLTGQASESALPRGGGSAFKR